MTHAEQSKLNQTKHTLGPWEISRDAVPDWHHQYTVYAETGIGHSERVATVFGGNARVIAAAPDLLAAAILMRMIGHNSTRKQVNAACDALDAAIRKATEGAP